MSTRETILIIDDRRDNVTFLIDSILRPAGYGVSVANDGEQGLRNAIEEQPDLIIMDLNVPKLRGLDVLIRRHLPDGTGEMEIPMRLEEHIVHIQPHDH